MQVFTRFRRLIDGATMYRVTSVSLAALALVTLIISAVDPSAMLYSALGIALSMAVSIPSGVLFSWVFGKIMRRPAQLESAVITALILGFLMPADLTAQSVITVAFANLVAAGSKWIVTFRARHIFNPAALGAAVVTTLSMLTVPVLPAVWWIGAAPAFVPTLLVAVVIAYRLRSILRTFGVWIVLVGVSMLPLMVAGGISQFGTAAIPVLLSSPLLFLAAVMLTEPLTASSGVKRYFGIFATAIVLWIPAIFSFYIPTEIAILAGNLVAFAVSYKQLAIGKIELSRHEMLSPTIARLEFSTTRPVVFAPGQYIELDLPHKADLRGRRRVFSIANAPGHHHFDVLMRVPERTSSWKQAALSHPTQIWATGFGGEFTLPTDANKPILMVAHGIGITPFMSQIFSYRDRDIRLIWQVSDPVDLVVPSFPGAQVTVILPEVRPEIISRLPASWTVSAESLADVLGNQSDLSAREIYASGSPKFLTQTRKALGANGIHKFHTDAFTGY